MPDTIHILVPVGLKRRLERWTARRVAATGRTLTEPEAILALFTPPLLLRDERLRADLERWVLRSASETRGWVPGEMDGER